MSDLTHNIVMEPTRYRSRLIPALGTEVRGDPEGCNRQVE
jgi:hypothetical protein